VTQPVLNRFVTLALAVSPLLAACGDTYIEESLVETSSTIVETLTENNDVERTFNEHLDIIDKSLDDLSDSIVENDGSAAEILTSILQSWIIIEDDIKTNFPDSHFGFYEVMTLAELSVERRRPADASKAWKLFIDIAASIQ
jgi:hypothetical protein